MKDEQDFLAGLQGCDGKHAGMDARMHGTVSWPAASGLSALCLSLGHHEVTEKRGRLMQAQEFLEERWTPTHTYATSALLYDSDRRTLHSYGTNTSMKIPS